MSGKMKEKSISLSRSNRITQTPPEQRESAKLPCMTDEDKAHASNVENALNSPIARSSRLCSTPIHKSRDFTDESLDQDIRESPTLLFPCTQESNEIAWDWYSSSKKHEQSPNVDKSKRSNGVLINTPKRRQLLHKKRLAKSNSPLLNIPPKRKLCQNQIAESIGKFAEELSALAEKIKTEQNNEQSNAAAASNSHTLGIFDMPTQVLGQEELDIHEVPTLENNDVVDTSSVVKNDSEKPDSSLDDLFDDSIDDCMVQCSQEIESKLNLESDPSENSASLILRTSGDEIKKPISSTGASALPRGNVHSDPCTSSTRNISGNACTGIPEKAAPDKSVVEDNIPASQIPDDSMDDCLAQCLEEDEDLLSRVLDDDLLNGKPKCTNAPPKSYSRNAGPTNFRPKIPTFNYSSASNQNKPIPKSVAVASSKVVDSVSNSKRKQQCMSSENTSSMENRKFFKIKSLSDSYCGNSNFGKSAGKSACNSTSNQGTNFPRPISKSTSNCNLNLKNRANEVFSVPNWSNSNSAAGSNNMCNSTNKLTVDNHVSYSYRRSNNNNLMTSSATGNCDQYKVPRTPLDIPVRELRTGVPLNSQQLRCTPEEIERKRVEARMRLEANKLRKQMDSSKPKTGISLPMKRPVVKR